MICEAIYDPDSVSHLLDRIGNDIYDRLFIRSKFLDPDTSGVRVGISIAQINSVMIHGNGCICIDIQINSYDRIFYGIP